MKIKVGEKVVFIKEDFRANYFAATKDNRIVSIPTLQVFIKIKDGLFDKLFNRSMYKFENTDVIIDLKKFENRKMLKKVEGK